MERLRKQLGTRTGLCFLLLSTFSVLSAAQQHKGTSALKSQAADERNWTVQCEADNSSLNDSQCGLWASRKEFLLKAKCPDHDATVSCASFQELVKADDADMMSDMARQDHVYACFRPEQDVFSEIYFSGAGGGGGVAEVRYYRNGIASPAMSFHDSGKWTRTSAGDAVFAGDTIRIAGSQLEASQTYKNESSLEIHHTLVLQLSTGRFTEKYNMQPSGESVDDFSGRCFVLPTAQR